MDLFYEFVDLFRQYGCDETNDRQLRDGSRFAVSKFEEAGNSWINYLAPGYTWDDYTSYDLIHQPWTGMAAMRRRELEPFSPGTYGYMAQKLEMSTSPMVVE
jgi:hypothetical protein